MERVIPARACAHVADICWEAEVEREGEEAESRARIAPLLPLFRLACIGDANNDAMSDPGAAGLFPLTGTRRRRTMRMHGSTRTTTTTTTMRGMMGMRG
jgi:hypothetical protein